MKQYAINDKKFDLYKLMDESLKAEIMSFPYAVHWNRKNSKEPNKYLYCPENEYAAMNVWSDTSKVILKRLEQLVIIFALGFILILPFSIQV